MSLVTMRFGSWVVVTVICAAFTQMCRTVGEYSSFQDDKILRLPGQPQIRFDQYAGYITIEETQQRSLFYYFVEAEYEPASRPLVLWLNGGPGCSSLGGGAFRENGPFRPRDGATLIKNNYSWNKEANMLYLESPAGVGFSYSANISFYSHVNDTVTAQDNLTFLRKWFIKFPKYKNRDLFITGESYAGHYIPQLAQLIVEAGSEFKLKGIAIGNPLLNFETDINSEGFFYWSRGLISDQTYQHLSATCNTSQIRRERQVIGIMSPACQQVEDLLAAEIPYNSLDQYDVSSDVCLYSGGSQLAVQNHPLRAFLSTRQFVQESSHQPAMKSANDTENVDLCIEKKVFDYLNRKDVQEALHSKLVGVTNWTICSSVLHYDLKNLLIPTTDILGSLVTSGIRVLIFSGDQDASIPFIGTRTLIQGLAGKMELNTTSSYRAWFHDKQVAGWTQTYGYILTFATIRGASHMAPFSSPERSLALFTTFLNGENLA